MSRLGSVLSPEFVHQGAGLILSDPSGTDRSQLVVVIAYRAIQNGFDARFTTTKALIDELSRVGGLTVTCTSSPAPRASHDAGAASCGRLSRRIGSSSPTMDASCSSSRPPGRMAPAHLVFEPLDFLTRLAALTPRPRIHLVFYHGLLAPNARWRAAVEAYGTAPGIEPVPVAEVAAGTDPPAAGDTASRPPGRGWTWAQLMRRAFDQPIDYTSYH